MKQVYSDLPALTGGQISGIFQIKIAPREWLATAPIIDFESGRVLNAVSFISGKNFISIELAPESYDYTEKPKSSRGGTFYDISMTGTSNNLDASTQQLFETLRNHEFVVLLKDRKKRWKLVGDNVAGCILQVTYHNGNASGGVEVATFDLSMETESRPPFYEV